MTPGTYPSNLTLWLDAAAITGLTDGQTVATWSDRSAAGNHATGVNAPTYRTGVLSGKPVVRFPATGYFTSSAPTGGNLQTVIAVVQAPTSGARTVRGATSDGGMQVRMDGGTTVRVRQIRQAVQNIMQGTQSIASSAWGVLVATAQAGVQYRCSWGDTTPTAMAMANFSASTTSIGRSGSSGGVEYLNGDLAELATWDRELTVPEINSVVTGLKSKWGIA